MKSFTIDNIQYNSETHRLSYSILNEGYVCTGIETPEECARDIVKTILSIAKEEDE